MNELLKITDWLGNVDIEELDIMDQITMSSAFMKVAAELKPIYDKYNKTKNVEKNTANLLGDEFARDVLKGFINCYKND